MYGSKGAVGEQRLDSAQNNFERGQQDVFKVCIVATHTYNGI
jgi:hypothetical protein